MSSLFPSALFPAVVSRRGAGLFASLLGYALAFCLCMSVFVFQAHASDQNTASVQTTNSGKFDFQKSLK